MTLKRFFTPLGLVLALNAGVGAEYPLSVGSQVLFDVTTTAMGAYPMKWRYELWVVDQRKEGGMDAVWVNYAYVGQPQESLVGAIPLTIKKDGFKEFPMEREVTYSLQEQVESFIPTLPGRFDQIWKGPASVTGWYSSYQPLEVLSDRIRCSFTQYGVDKIDAIVGTETLGEIFFDSRFSWVVEMGFSTKQPSPQGQITVSQAKATLTQVLQRDQNWANERKADATEFFRTVLGHDQALLKANDDLKSATMDLSKMLALWETYLQKNPTSRFVRLAQNQQRSLQSSIPALQQFWAIRKKAIGSPAPPWTLRDTEGGTYSLESFQAPVLLLFWTRTNWWSLMAVRQIQDIQAEYQARGLLVLPVNVDATDQEAVHALTTMGARLTSLRNMDPNLITAYGIPLGAFPSTVLIDRDKRIADVRYGWGKQVVEEIKKRIEKAL
jgi:peroxiredoxin